MSQGRAGCSSRRERLTAAKGKKHFADCIYQQLQITGTGKVLVATRLRRSTAGHSAELGVGN